MKKSEALLEKVKQLSEKGLRGYEIAKELGVASATVCRWIKEAESRQDVVEHALHTGVCLLTKRLERALEEEHARRYESEDALAKTKDDLALKELIAVLDWLQKCKGVEKGTAEEVRVCLAEEVKTWVK